MTRPAASRTVTWIANGATVLLVTQLAVSGVLLILRPTIMTDVVRHLGYPDYFPPMLGVAKLLAAIAIAYPRVPVLTEWAYAGVVFDLLAVVVSHSAIHDAMRARAEPLPILVLVAVSYVGVHARAAAVAHLAFQERAVYVAAPRPAIKETA